MTSAAMKGEKWSLRTAPLSEEPAEHFVETVDDRALGAAALHAGRGDFVAHLLVGGIVGEVTARAVAVGHPLRAREGQFENSPVDSERPEVCFFAA